MMKLISCILLACFLSLMGCETQQQKEIKRLVGELKHEDPEISFKAKETLVETGREAVPFLIRALKGKGEKDPGNNRGSRHSDVDRAFER